MRKLIVPANALLKAKSKLDPKTRLIKTDTLGIDGVWPEYHVFASRAAAERSVIGFEAEGFHAKIYRTASWPTAKCREFPNKAKLRQY